MALLVVTSLLVTACAGGKEQEQNKAMVRRYYEDGWNAGNLDAVEDILASDIRLQVPPFPIAPLFGELEGVKYYVNLQSTGFPDLLVTIDDIVAEEDQVVVRYTFKGKNEGEYEDIRWERHSPTGMAVKYSGIAIYRCADGKIVEVWDYVDWLSLYEQIRVIGPR